MEEIRDLEFSSHFCQKMGSLFCKWQEHWLCQNLFAFIFVGFLGLPSDFRWKIMVLSQFIQIQLWLVLCMF